jgi:hypothetical protein
MPHRDHAGLRLVRHGSDDRADVSAFIRAKFLKDHGAHLHHPMPHLFSLRRPGDEIVAAFGLREAGHERLFMECYLDEPVESRIARLSGREVARDRIIEVGNLAASPGGARAMIMALTKHLHESGIEWVTFTGVLALRHAFQRLGLRPLSIAAATPDRLSESERALWGRYFESRPVVMAGYVPHGHRMLMRRQACAWQTALALEQSETCAS